MTTALCEAPGSGTFRFFFDQGEAQVRGWAQCAGYAHSLAYSFPTEAQPDGTYAFDAEHARLRVAADGTLLFFEELNDLFSAWVRFTPDA